MRDRDRWQMIYVTIPPVNDTSGFSQDYGAVYPIDLVLESETIFNEHLNEPRK
jgi:hypothetical protein